jgi:hypothetical protein
MALVLADRVKESSATTGTGDVTLAGAGVGFQTFAAAIGNGNTTYYTIADQNGVNWEVGIGVYASSGNTLVRNTVLSSSNSGSLVNFTSGSKDVFVTLPAERAITTGALQILTRAADIVNVAVYNGYISILNHFGATINVSVN